MSDPGTTVGVATCGRPEALARCLGALAEQTEPPAEVIVVDQDPSHRARSVVAASGLPAAYVEQARLGLSASRNLALRLAAGARLAVTDDDCVPERCWLAALRAALERPPSPAAVTGPILPLGDPPPGTYAVSLRQCHEQVDHSGRVQPWSVGSGANFAAPVEILRGCSGWEERLGAGSAGRAAEDADLLYRLLLQGSIVRYDPSIVVRHEWQDRERRLATRWSYGYGIGAMCGLCLARRDVLHALWMLGGYAGLHVRPLLGGLRRRDRMRTSEHVRALASLAPGLLQGIRPGRQPSGSISPGER